VEFSQVSAEDTARFLSGKRSNRLSYRPVGVASRNAIWHAGLGYRNLGLAAQSDSLSVTSMPPASRVTRLYSTAPMVARAVIRTTLMAPTSMV
jgi:hypothetical protein